MTTHDIDRLIANCTASICIDPALVDAYDRRAAAVNKHVRKLVEELRPGGASEDPVYRCTGCGSTARPCANCAWKYIGRKVI